jgi:hypothetical protein
MVKPSQSVYSTLPNRVTYNFFKLLHASSVLLVAPSVLEVYILDIWIKDWLRISLQS